MPFTRSQRRRPVTPSITSRDTNSLTQPKSHNRDFHCSVHRSTLLIEISQIGGTRPSLHCPSTFSLFMNFPFPAPAPSPSHSSPVTFRIGLQSSPAPLARFRGSPKGGRRARGRRRRRTTAAAKMEKREHGRRGASHTDVASGVSRNMEILLSKIVFPHS